MRERQLNHLFESLGDPSALVAPLVFVAIVAFLAFLISALRQGSIVGAGDRVYAFLVSLVGDLIHLSPRRTAAVAWLAIKETLRKQAAAGMVIFVLVLAFALWFLDDESINPAAQNVNFVLNAINYLILLIALLTSTFSLPNDLKNKTIYTVVTKPVRPSEIVLGRMIGFTIVCSIPLAIMSVGGYLFIVRSLDHRHELTEADLRPIPVDALGRTSAGSKQGTTSTTHNHRHRVIIGPDGNGLTEMNDADRLQLDDSSGFLDRFGLSHHHAVTSEKIDGRTVYHVGPPLGQLHARVPIKGTLRFLDREGMMDEEGYNVGNWTKRGYVAGGTLSAAIFTFEGVTEDQFREGLPLELDIRLFRTTKADMNKPILGGLVVRNPVTRLASAARNFAAREYFTIDQFIPRKLTDAEGNPIDLFRDLVVDGRVQLELQCIPRSQFFGVGPDDVYLLAREGRFDVNVAKGFVGIGLQMVLTIFIGVMFSTFLSGPVAMLTTAAVAAASLLRPFLLDVVRDNLYEGKARTGGVLESLVRMTNQQAVTKQLEEGATTTVIQSVDKGMSTLVEQLLRLVPDFSAMNDVSTVAAGFDIPADLLWLHVVQTALFAIPLFLLGLIIFKQTEVAK